MERNRGKDQRPEIKNSLHYRKGQLPLPQSPGELTFCSCSATFNSLRGTYRPYSAKSSAERVLLREAVRRVSVLSGLSWPALSWPLLKGWAPGALMGFCGLSIRTLVLRSLEKPVCLSYPPGNGSAQIMSANRDSEKCLLHTLRSPVPSQGIISRPPRRARDKHRPS